MVDRVFRPVASASGNLSHQERVKAVAETIAQMTISGEALDGDRLVSERALAELIHCSRRQIRAALEVLERRGDVRRIPRSGTYVTERAGSLPVASSSELESVSRLMTARLGLEPVAAQVAAQEASRAELLQIYDAMKKVEQNIDRGIRADDADTNFHQAIIRASHNPYIIGMMLMIDHLIRTHYAPFRQAMLRHPTLGRKFLEQHAAIYWAIREHRPEEAAAATRAHVNYATHSVIEVVSDTDQTAAIPSPRTRAGNRR
jgi:GntR family transcriptional repressor for pyruvate dehydrogenase complex